MTSPLSLPRGRHFSNECVEPDIQTEWEIRPPETCNRKPFCKNLTAMLISYHFLRISVQSCHFRILAKRPLQIPARGFAGALKLLIHCASVFRENVLPSGCLPVPLTERNAARNKVSRQFGRDNRMLSSSLSRDKYVELCPHVESDSR